MRGTRAAALLPLGLLLALGLWACDDDGTRPTSATPTVSGTVTDAGGSAISHASVSLLFGVDGVELPGWDDPAKRIKSSISFAIAEAGIVRVTMLDFLRRPVRVLLDETLEAGIQEVTWNGQDEAGGPVPSGMYIALLEQWVDGAEEPLVDEHSILLYDPDLHALLERHHAITDGRGRFEIPLGLFPVGEPIVVTDLEGHLVEGTAISHRVHFYALIDDGGGLRFVDRYVEISDKSRSLRVDLVLP